MNDDSSDRPVTALKRARHLAEAALFFSFIGVFRAMGLDAASAVGGFIGRNFFYRAGVTNRARANLRAAFPEATDDAIETIVREMCDNLGRTVSEYAHLDKIGILGPGARIEVVGAEHAKAAVARGKGVIFFSGHFGNWEVMPFVATQLGFESAEVYRPQNNPFVDRWLVHQRSRHGPKEQAAKGPRGTRRIFTMLRRGKSVCLLVDQKTNEGVPALYFGREAMTTPAPAALALKLGSALVPAQNERVGGSHFRVRFHPAIRTGEPYSATAGPVPHYAALPASSLADNAKPLVVIKFDGPNVDYQKDLYAALNQALQTKPSAAFEVLAVAPTAATAAAVAAAQTSAKRHARDVVQTMAQMGVPAGRVQVASLTDPAVQQSEVRVFAR
jgi:KDO2-lipid IV(A) lauroyltransferase